MLINNILPNILLKNMSTLSPKQQKRLTDEQKKQLLASADKLADKALDEASANAHPLLKVVWFLLAIAVMIGGAWLCASCSTLKHTQIDLNKEGAVISFNPVIREK